MAETREPPSEVVPQRKKRGLMPPEVMELIVPPLKVGTWSGAVGAMVGVGASIARDTNPVVSGIVGGARWFTLGGSYWFARTVTIRAWGDEAQLRPVDKTMASAIAGSAAGAVAGLGRGPSNILPFIALWGAIGAGGQAIANHVATSETKVKDENDSWMRSKWSPLKKLTDAEYVELMNEKILAVEVDIALIDDRIAELRASDKKS